jgi:hypothetical protein
VRLAELLVMVDTNSIGQWRLLAARPSSFFLFLSFRREPPNKLRDAEQKAEEEDLQISHTSMNLG